MLWLPTPWTLSPALQGGSQGQSNDIVSPYSPGSSSGPLPGSACPECALMDTLLLEHGVRYGQTVTNEIEWKLEFSWWFNYFGIFPLINRDHDQMQDRTGQDKHAACNSLICSCMKKKKKKAYNNIHCTAELCNRSCVLNIEKRHWNMYQSHHTSIDQCWYGYYQYLDQYAHR